eukprot:GFYU01002945.1.p1 GENE.GFYU01002945.1~~GFYU01002945.1.p1  ORF type:complete len:164 (-),score=34.74 GFYU01002945.1:290-781(-)
MVASLASDPHPEMDIDIHSETDPVKIKKKMMCDACPGCDDVCTDVDCRECAPKRVLFSSDDEKDARANKSKRYTRCQVKRHNTTDDCWIYAHNKVYDATHFITRHPGGAKSILRRAGGDTTDDFDFHSAKSTGKNGLWAKHFVGKLVDCPHADGEKAQGCSIM